MTRGGRGAKAPPSPRSAQTYARSASRRRRLRRAGLSLIVVLVAVGVAWFALAEGRSPPPAAAPPAVRVLVGNQVVLKADVARLRAEGRKGQRRWLASVPDLRVSRPGRARVELRLNRPLLERRLRQALAAGGHLRAPYEAVAATISLPIVKQALRNNCETAALSMLLRVQGIRVAQLTLQRQLPAARPRDPQGNVWGDPTRGFVGRPEGGGPAGGFGVYEAPVSALASQRGARLKRLSGGSPSLVYRSLLRGEPVMTWVGLSDGPFRTWRTPTGKTVVGNFGEHTVVLTGLSRAGVRVHDPLTGTVKTWTRSDFELMWARLGRRALAAPAAK